jgi:hypothetical protein
VHEGSAANARASRIPQISDLGRSERVAGPAGAEKGKRTEPVVAVRLGRLTNRRLSASARLATVGFGQSPCSVRCQR